MDSRSLLVLSVIADILDLLVIGNIPGLSWFIDIPLILLHFAAGGPAALVALLEAIPLVGLVPIFTWLAWRYHNTGVYGA